MNSGNLSRAVSTTGKADCLAQNADVEGSLCCK